MKSYSLPEAIDLHALERFVAYWRKTVRNAHVDTDVLVNSLQRAHDMDTTDRLFDDVDDFLAETS